MSSRPRSFLAIFTAARSHMRGCAATLCASIHCAVALFIVALCAMTLLTGPMCNVSLAAPASQPAAPLVMPLNRPPQSQLQGPPAHTPAQPKVAAYFEAGPYWEFSLLQKEIIKALQQRGVANYFVFPDEFHISPGWDAPDSVYRAEARKLMSNPAIDVIISMGTEATKALLLENNGKTPIMSVDVADPAGAGIVDPVTGKGAANLTIRYTKNKWFKVFALFHEALPFRRLGIMYHDSPEGLSYSNVREAREVARKHGVPRTTLRWRMAAMERELAGQQVISKSVKTALCLYDIHWPYQDQQSLEMAVQDAKQRYNVSHVIIGGDAADCESISRFARGPDTIPLNEEFELVVGGLGWLHGAKVNV